MSTEIELVVPPLDLTRQHEPRHSHDNCLRLLAQFEGRIAFESFAGKMFCTGLEALDLTDGEWSDEHTTALVQRFEANNFHAPPTTVDRAVALHARRHQYNALSNFLRECALAWDGRPRVDRALTTYWGAPDDVAARAVSRVFLLSLAARGFEPGAKVDTCPVFVGQQGVRKSSSLRALVGQSWFADSPLPIGEKDGMQNLRGTWLWEFSENESLSRKERNAVKAFLSSCADKYRPSHARHTITVPRQTCFVASTNDVETLTDPTGNRRFLPVHVAAIDLPGIERDRLQLLGEAAKRVDDYYETWWPTPAEEQALAPRREEATVSDPWVELIVPWLTKQRQPFQVTAVFAELGPIPMPASRIGRRDRDRAAAILTGRGFTSRKDKSRGPTRDLHLWWRWNRDGA